VSWKPRSRPTYNPFSGDLEAVLEPVNGAETAETQAPTSSMMMSLQCILTNNVWLSLLLRVTMRIVRMGIVAPCPQKVQNPPFPTAAAMQGGELRGRACQQLYHGCIRVQTESHGVCVYYNRGGELAKDRDGMFLVCAKSLPETTTSTSTLPQMTTSTTSSTRPCIAHTTRYCMSYDAVHEDVRMKPCAADKSCERFMRQGSAFEAKCARGRCLTVQSAPRPEYPNCHSMFFEACNPSDQYQQWNKVLLSGQSGNAWKNLATGTEFSPVSKKDGKTIMACKSSQVESSAFYSTFPERALGL